MRLLSAMALAIGLMVGAPAMAADFPTKPVKMIVPFPPGGGTDILARPLAEELSKLWNQPVVVENRAGAGGGIGSEAAARATPDGYTMVLGTVGTHAINQSLYSKLGYDGDRDFDAITLVANTPNILVVNSQVKAKSTQELIALAKQRPGVLNYASPGNGTPPHLAAEVFKKMADVSITHIPYKGTGPALTDLLGDSVQMMIANAPAVIPHVKSGKLIALSSTSEKRSAVLPDIPTLDESGLTGYEADTWYGLFTAKGTPDDVLNKLNRDIVTVLKSERIRQLYAEQGADIIASSSEQATNKVRNDIEKWKEVVDELNLKLD